MSLRFTAHIMIETVGLLFLSGHMNNNPEEVMPVVSKGIKSKSEHISLDSQIMDMTVILSFRIWEHS